MKMQNYVHSYTRFFVIDIEKPLYTHNQEDCVRVNETYIKKATQNCQYIVIRTPQGEKIFMPKELKKVGKRVKEVFLYPENPMILYEVMIPHSKFKDEDYFRFS